MRTAGHVQELAPVCGVHIRALAVPASCTSAWRCLSCKLPHTQRSALWDSVLHSTGRLVACVSQVSLQALCTTLTVKCATAGLKWDLQQQPYVSS